MSAKKARDEALKRLELAGKVFLILARTKARIIAINGDGTCTVDQVRKVIQPPEGKDPRIMGVIFRDPAWQKVDSVNSRRKTCHARPIAVFKYVGCGA
jgi:hypothetical protein